MKKTYNSAGISISEKEPPRHREAGFLFFRADRKLVKVMTSDILYIESLKDYIQIISTNSKPLVVKHTISTVEAMLPADQFVRIHRSYIAAISRVTTYTPRHVDVAGQQLPIGRLYQKEVERVLNVSW
ncbi:MAG: LytTR family DNA-binding domain-containing protein [Dyadobacter sp.]|uniref:LytR/AlgR family response regulator transcription factor n=1 Tax=Dyadobacter sp. TaxID=1914288 RepID=UPI003267AE9E